ncbi:hypothetical protein DUNSADRAFT_13661 [Dunaliella salina]|uniref:Plastid lipid-associated protein/fibrillin conserved domain-containing protein n=1 Tax=Dunaliella salina TaxID=3046 RepID=A0ABQ7G901_DUNSA|nr:hypothetical protein DUNSADRAFT_13661 [Dunaliella salina]|eukprot:KAF5831050.1 hypothetical protein DUNSADRAFT_13661 [Dunaliella salina]
MLSLKTGHRACLRGRVARTEKGLLGLSSHRHRQLLAHPLASSQQKVDRELTDNGGISGALQVLRKAATRKSVAPREVEEAMAHVEKHQQQHEQIKQASSIDGKWRLVFSTSTKLRMFQYIPVKEDVRIDVQAKKISLESVLGPFDFLINGEVCSFTEATCALEFQFKEVQVFMSRNKVWAKERPPTPAKTYTFFYVDPEEGTNNTIISIARSSAGGMSLLLRNPE